jgi:phospholipase C
VAEVLDILTRNPEIWKQTVFLLTYDENDGYFDHVPPFVTPEPGRPESGKVSAGIDAAAEHWTFEQDRLRARPDDARGGPVGLGFRVPLVVASPWSRGGYVCSQVFDHTSVLQLLEKLYGVAEPNINSWRRAVCGDLTSAFRPYRGEAGRNLPHPAQDDFLKGIHQAQFTPMPSGWEPDRHPRQEPGTRPSNPLPYELAVNGVMRDDALHLKLEARTARFGARSAGSGFHAYTPGLFRGSAALRTRAYAVKAGESVTDSWSLEGFPGGRYDVRVCGPNGFLRSFQGDASDPSIRVVCEDAAPALMLRIANAARSDYRMVITDLCYGAPARAVTVKAASEEVIRLTVDAGHRWYDFEIRVDGEPVYGLRLAGRVETGEAAVSDPGMAGLP